MARRRLPAEEEGHESSERWLLTYADMITLLMVLFIVLFAIGQIDQKKFDELHAGLSQSFGQSTVVDGGAGILQGNAVQAPAPDDTRAGEQALARQQQSDLAARVRTASMDKVRSNIVTALAKAHLTGAAKFHQEERGLVVDVVTDRVLFDLGSATLRPEGSRVLDAIAPSLRPLPNRLLIEGHTDDLPISGQRFASNWELSTQRATVVLRHLLGDGVRPDTVAAAGYADQRPLVSGDSAAARARNRRVAIVILSTAREAVQADGPGAAPFPAPGA